MVTVNDTVVEVRCLGCKELIERPSEADMDLFRIGIRIHDRAACFELVMDEVPA
jgi:hypothetical protein